MPRQILRIIFYRPEVNFAGRIRKFKKGLKLRPSILNHSEFFVKLLTMTISISWPSSMTKWFTFQILKNILYLVCLYNKHYQVMTYEVDRIDQDIKWKSVKKEHDFFMKWKNSYIVPQKEIFRSYHFLAEVTANFCQLSYILIY